MLGVVHHRTDQSEASAFQRCVRLAQAQEPRDKQDDDDEADDIDDAVHGNSLAG